MYREFKNKNVHTHTRQDSDKCIKTPDHIFGAMRRGAARATAPPARGSFAYEGWRDYTDEMASDCAGELAAVGFVGLRGVLEPGTAASLSQHIDAELERHISEAYVAKNPPTSGTAIPL